MDLFDGLNLGNQESPKGLKEVFSGQLKAGNLADALRTVSGLSFPDANRLMLEAGFSIVGSGSTKKGQREFWQWCQQEVARACRHRVDGWGLRDVDAESKRERDEENELDARGSVRAGNDGDDRGDGLTGGTDRGSLGGRLAGADQEADAGEPAARSAGEPGEQGTRDDGASQQHELSGASRTDGTLRDRAESAGVTPPAKEWVSETEAERLSQAYCADLEGKAGQPKPIKLAMFNGKPVTVFSILHNGGIEKITGIELVPVEQYAGETCTHDQLMSLWNMGLVPRGDHTGMLVQARGKTYVSVKDLVFLNRDNPRNFVQTQDADEAEHVVEEDFDIEETQTGLAVDQVDAANLREHLEDDIDPATDKPIHSQGRRLQLESELENLESGIAHAQEVLAATAAVSQLQQQEPPTEEAIPRIPGEYQVGDRVVLKQAVNDDLVGRHAEVIEARPIMVRTVHLFSNEPEQLQRVVHYTVRTDEGTKLPVDADYLVPEIERPRVVIPDPMVDGEYMPPRNVYSSIDYFSDRARKYEGDAARARKAENKASAHRQADAMKAKADTFRQVWNEWASLNPEAAQAIAGPITKAADQEVLQEPSALPSGVRLASFKHTQTGATKYAVNLEKRVDREMYQRINAIAGRHGGRWSSFSRGGAIPGFLFDSDEAARRWVHEIAPIVGLELPAVAAQEPLAVAAAAPAVAEVRPDLPAIEVPPAISEPDTVAIIPLTSGAYKGWFQAKAVDGPHAGVVGDADRTEEGARRALTTTIQKREQVQLQADQHKQEAASYALGQAEADELLSYFQERYAEEPDRYEAFARMLNRAVDGVVEEQGAKDAFKDPVRWAGEWLQIARGGKGFEEFEAEARAIEAPPTAAVAEPLSQAPVLAEELPQVAAEAVTTELSQAESRTTAPIRVRPSSAGIAEAPTDFVIRDEDEIGKGGPKKKYRDNIEAIRLIRQLDETGCRASADEQRILARYVGWGGLKGVFNPDNTEWAAERAELTSLLTADEYAAARRSQLDAHYTSPLLIKSIYGGLQQLGFDGGKVLESSIGIGNFVGLMPPEMRARSHVIGAELDMVTGRIAQHLYPNSDITVGKGFQEIAMPSGFFDAAIGNPPFGNQSVFDSEHPELSRFSLHNFFFAKSLDKLRPGGVMAKVVSRYFMDSQDSEARQWIAERAKLLGAYRLPNTAFKENANTEVVTDIIFLQKLTEGEAPDLSWVETVDRALGDAPATEDGRAIRINRYFAENPDRILGRETVESNQYTSAAYTVEAEEGWEARLPELVRQTLPQGVYRAGIAPEILQKWVDADTIMPDYTKVGAYFVGPDGEVYQRLSDQFDKPRALRVEFQTSAATERAKGMIGVRDALRSLMRRELAMDSNELELMQLRATLNRTYDGFVKRHGYINSLGNRRAFAEDPDLPLLESLEPNYDPGISREVAAKQGVELRKPSAGKADIFRRRVLVPYAEVSRVENAKDGLIASLNHRGRVDLDFICSLYGKKESETIAELRGLIYRDPDKGWVTADEYLSGNVKHKLARAKDAANADPALAENVAALEAVQPADIPPMDIRVRLGSPWVPPWVVEQFAKELWSPTALEVSYIPAVAQWSFSSAGGDHVALTSRWGTSHVPANRIMDSLLNNRSIVVRENIGSAREPHWIVLEKETEAARAKAEEVGQRFKDWIWQDHERSEKLARIYNDTMNTNRERTFDGKHLTLPGANPAIELRPSQKSAIWRGVSERVVLLDHRVGAGKTYTKIGIAMEMRRLGVLKKPMLCVPNHLVRQWRDSFYSLYPGANVLAATEADFEKDNRHKLFARITTGDWDAVIIGHSSLKKIGLPAETEQGVLQEMLDDISDAIERLKIDRGDRNVTRDMERIKDNLKAKMNKLNERTGAKDNVVTFDELGVDGLFVDELDEFKNLFFTTTMQQVAGLGNSAGSGKAFDLFVKRRWLTERYGEQAVFVGGTGTPISNSLVEMYTMQRYMIYDEMRRRGIHLLDAWAGCFGDVQHVYEVHPSGSGYRLSTRFAKFVNMPELMTLYKGFADVVTLDDLKAQAEARGQKFPIPKLAGGKPKNLVAERSELQELFFGVPVFARGDDGRILFSESREPENIGFYQMPDSKWIWTTKGSEGNYKVGKFASREEAVADFVADYLTPRTGFNKDSILDQYENLRELTRRTKGKVNALSITNSARKAGLDYRLIDPSAPDHPGSKINMAADEIVRIYRKWEKDRGTQLVFCDLSVPLSERERIGSAERKAFIRDDAGELAQVKATTHPVPDTEEYVFYAVKQGRMYHAYDAITGNHLPVPPAQKRSELVDAVLSRTKAGLDWYDRARGETPPIDDAAIEAWRAERNQGDEGLDNEASDQVTLTDLLAVAGKSRFSVYDDLRAKLVERGIPNEEIAFIHDYDTTKKKADLFKAINDGRMRVTIGSTPKMGAGTNVQERLVGLHHLDCPWRPRDLEQRDGRIERQGNKLYERDPEGFEVEIMRYATKQTYDTRMWQIVEHKARGVQQLRKAGKAEREIDDLGGEAASAADMKAAASGNPLILEEIRLRNEVKSLDAQRDGWLRTRHDLGRRMVWLRDAFGQEEHIKGIFQPMIERRDQHSTGEFQLSVEGRRFDRKDAAKVVELAMARCVRSRPGEVTDIGEYRGFRFELSRENAGARVGFGMPGKKAEFHVAYYDIEHDKFSASGLIQRMDNRLAEFEENIESAIAKRRQAEQEIPQIEAELQLPFAKEAELTEKREAHREVIGRLKKAGGSVQLTAEMREELRAALPARIATLASHGLQVDQELLQSLTNPPEEGQAKAIPANSVSMEESLDRALQYARNANATADIAPKETQGIVYAGKVVDVQEHHVVQDIGRMLVVHRKADLENVPARDAYVRLSYDPATGKAAAHRQDHHQAGVLTH